MRKYARKTGEHVEQLKSLQRASTIESVERAFESNSVQPC